MKEQGEARARSLVRRAGWGLGNEGQSRVELSPPLLGDAQAPSSVLDVTLAGPMCFSPLHSGPSLLLKGLGRTLT